jgi:o-succinylbenzoate synthase
MTSIRTQLIPKTLQFKQPAGTSRGVYTERKVWFIKITDEEKPEHWGIGEVAPLPNLSCDDVPDFQEVLEFHCRNFSGEIPYEDLEEYPSILFGLETAWRHFNSNGDILWNTPFAKGEEGITINGLIWMGSYEEMKERIEEKLKAGFHCIKIKIGAIDFEKEFSLLEQIRNDYSPERITLRVDANGAFSPLEAMEKLQRLASLQIHSIEQPIRAGQWDEMAKLCRATPLPIALDEELIGINTTAEKSALLDTIRPQYIILKPSLHGGIRGSEEWIRLAQKRNIGYWITSALESNIGLLAIAQWTSTLNPSIPQGLGTGALYTNNIDLPLKINGEKLWIKGNTPLFKNINLLD